jgi:hypothetical protein
VTAVVEGNIGWHSRQGCLDLIIRRANSDHKTIGENDGDDQGVTDSKFIESYLHKGHCRISYEIHGLLKLSKNIPCFSPTTQDSRGISRKSCVNIS